ncbi:MAG: hypothetical protein JNL28_08210 [Planctomycetes bacterium]|nr:hypothetical protein [Planctomycetota bacterium]
MKRVLLFVLLFGAGFAVLWHMRARPDDPKQNPDLISKPAQQGEFSPITVPSGKKEGDTSTIDVSIRGALDFEQRASAPGSTELKQKINLHANNVEPRADNAYDMQGLRIKVYDPATEKLRAEMRSPLSRVQVSMESGSPALSKTEPIKLTDVELTLHEGGPVAPLEFAAPKLDWLLADTSFTSEERVKIRGKGVTADGLGLRAGANTASFELLRDATIRFELERGQTVTLKSGAEGGVAAKTVVRDGLELIDVVATSAARLAVEGAQPMTISADRIHMLGRKTGRVEDPYEILSADAEGNVVADSRGDTFKAQAADFTFTTGGKLKHASLERDVELAAQDDHFFSDHAEFDFDVKGDLERATLTGSPRGDIAVGRYIAAERPDLAQARSQLAGVGPLVVTRVDGDTVDLTGPATLSVAEAGLTLRAADRIVGRDERATKSGRVNASGDVVVDYGPNEIKCDALELSWMLVAGAPTALVSTTGVTTVNGTAPDGRKVATIARGGLGAVVTKEKITITEARDVEITSAEEGGLHAKARLVRDFDWDKRTFQAEGAVTFESAQGNGSAERIEAVSRDEVRMFGTRSKRARYDFARPATDEEGELIAHVEAGEISAQPDRVVARENVTAKVATKDTQVDLESGELDLALEPEDPTNRAAPREFHARAHTNVKSKIVRGEDRAQVACGVLTIDGRVTTQGRGSVSSTNIRASEAVHVDYTGAGSVIGDGDLFTLDDAGLARLSADEGRKVKAKGRFIGNEMPFTLEADWLEIDRDHFAAQGARAKLEPPAKASDAAVVVEPEVSERQQGPGAEPAVLRELRADMMRAENHEISLVGDAHIEGVTLDGEAWKVDAASIRVRGDFSKAKRLETSQIASIDAEGGFHAVLGERMEASGERLRAVPERIRVEGAPAHMTMFDAEWESAWIQYDTANMLLSTDKGALRSRVGTDGMSWSIEYESMQPFDQEQKTILVMRNPRFRFGPDQLFAEWTLFWVDREEWRRSGRRTLNEAMKGEDLRVSTPVDSQRATTPAPRADKSNPFLQMPDIMKAAQNNPLFRVLSEVYIEGNIEVFSEGERNARASAIYLDIADTQGWIQDADVSVDINIRGFRQRLRAKAEWMRIAPTPDGPSLRAEKAEITSCEFDHPHYVIETGDLRITPRKNTSDERVAYGFSTRRNRLRFENGIQIPLPSIAPELNRKGRPLIDRFVLGNSARYGAALRATVNAELGPIGKATGRAIGSVLKIPDVDLDGNWHYNIGILGSRGVLLGMGLDLDAGEKFKLETDFDLIPDRRGDRGLVRVDPDDRSLIRTWFRARSRYTIRDGEWVDLAFSRQSDAAVQSEFFEREYLRYENKDNYLHWRKAQNEWYWNASVKGHLENRREIDELPSAGAYRGRTQIGYAFDNPIYYSARADAGYFRRHDGDPRYYSPFEDGLGNRDVARFDTEHKVEAPFSLGVLAARGTPYLTARGTLWDEGADPESAPSRTALIAGFDATTTFWRRFSGGSVHTISPTIGVHADIISQDSGGELVQLDNIEDPIDGRFIDLGVRSRWWRPDTNERMDLSVRASHGSDLPEGQASGVQPIFVLGDYLTFVDEIPIGMTHDGRYDTRTGNTTYSLTSVGIEPWRKVGFEFGYQRGLSTVDQERLFEAASIAARYRWTPKWEMEAGQSYAIAEGTGVGSNFTLRRLGHDFVTEIEISHRSGEGTAFSLNFQPRITWKRSGLGLLDRWLGLYH